MNVGEVLKRVDTCFEEVTCPEVYCNFDKVKSEYVTVNSSKHNRRTY